MVTASHDVMAISVHRAKALKVKSQATVVRVVLRSLPHQSCLSDQPQSD
jgi:hypothetical protein